MLGCPRIPDVLVRDGIICVLVEIAIQRHVLGYLVLELSADCCPDEEGVLHLLLRSHDDMYECV